MATIVTVVREDEVEPIVFHLSSPALAEYFAGRVSELPFVTLVEIHVPKEITGQNGVDAALRELEY